MADRQSPLRRSRGSHSRGSRTHNRDHIPSNARRSRSRIRRPDMRHSNRHIPLLRRQYRGEEPKESVSPVWLPFPSRRKPSRGDQQCSYIYGIRIRERFHVLDSAIGVANTVAQSWSGPISCDSLFPVAHDRKIESLVRRRPTESRSAIRCQRLARFTETDLHMPVFPIYLLSAFRNSTR